MVLTRSGLGAFARATLDRDDFPSGAILRPPPTVELARFPLGESFVFISLVFFSRSKWLTTADGTTPALLIRNCFLPHDVCRLRAGFIRRHVGIGSESSAGFWQSSGQTPLAPSRGPGGGERGVSQLAAVATRAAGTRQSPARGPSVSPPHPIRSRSWTRSCRSTPWRSRTIPIGRARFGPTEQFPAV